MKNYALIKNSIVMNCIVADDSFIPVIKSEYDFIVDLSSYTSPVSPGAAYDSTTGTFVEPMVSADNTIYQSTDVVTGNATTFAPFNLSNDGGGFTVSCSSDTNTIVVGCRSYDMRWLRNEMTLLCTDGKPRGAIFYATTGGVLDRGALTTWADANLILTALNTLIA
jgi:hypothetical protein